MPAHIPQKRSHSARSRLATECSNACGAHKRNPHWAHQKPGAPDRELSGGGTCRWHGDNDPLRSLPSMGRERSWPEVETETRELAKKPKDLRSLGLTSR